MRWNTQSLLTNASVLRGKGEGGGGEAGDWIANTHSNKGRFKTFLGYLSVVLKWQFTHCQKKKNENQRNCKKWQTYFKLRKNYTCNLLPTIAVFCAYRKKYIFHVACNGNVRIGKQILNSSQLSPGVTSAPAISIHLFFVFITVAGSVTTVSKIQYLCICAWVT